MIEYLTNFADRDQFGVDIEDKIVYLGTGGGSSDATISFADVFWDRCSFGGVGEKTQSGTSVRVFCSFHPVLWGLMFFANFPFCVLISELFLLHVYLILQGLTTYEYILIKERMQREQVGRFLE